MRCPLGIAFPAVALALAVLSTGCTSSQEKTNQGSLGVRLAASRPTTASESAAVVADDPLSRLLAINVNISAIEARRSDGTWAPLEGVFPEFIDLLALANVGDTVTFPADLLPEGHYAALQVRVAQVDLTHRNGTRVRIAPRGAGWVVSVPVDFGVVSDQATVVGLNVRLERSLRLVNGEFEFDPEIEVDGVERN
jgi:hypothetical protein